MTTHAQYIRACSNNQWLDQYGTPHYIPDMSMQHISNCIKMCEQRPGWRDRALSLLKTEYNKRYIPNR